MAEAKKTTRKAAAAKKPVEKAAEKKAEMKTELVIQFNGNDYTPERLVQSAKDVWLYDLGNEPGDIKSLQLFVKPEEGRVYALINGTETISFII